jgi:hypothetical protein
VKHFYILLFSLAACLNSCFAWSAAPTKLNAEPMAILIAADWCFNCKIIEPKLRDAFKGFERKINLVNLDLTDDKRFFEAKQVVFSLGVPKLLQGKVAVGWVALYDRHGRQVGKLLQDMSIEEMRQALQSLSGI